MKPFDFQPSKLKTLSTFNFGNDFFFRWSQIGFSPGTRRLPSDEDVTTDPWTGRPRLSLINQSSYFRIFVSFSFLIWCFNSFSPLSLSWLIKSRGRLERANQRSDEIDENEREFRPWKLLLSGACRDQEQGSTDKNWTVRTRKIREIQDRSSTEKN